MKSHDPNEIRRAKRLLSKCFVNVAVYNGARDNLAPPVKALNALFSGDQKLRRLGVAFEHSAVWITPGVDMGSSIDRVTGEFGQGRKPIVTLAENNDGAQATVYYYDRTLPKPPRQTLATVDKTKIGGKLAGLVYDSLSVKEQNALARYAL